MKKRILNTEKRLQRRLALISTARRRYAEAEQRVHSYVSRAEGFDSRAKRLEQLVQTEGRRAAYLAHLQERFVIDAIEALDVDLETIVRHFE